MVSNCEVELTIGHFKRSQKTMFILQTFLRNTKSKSLVGAVLSRHYAVLYEKEFTVVPFCNININLPFNVTMIPLDVYKYKDCNKVIVKVTSNVENSTANLECNHDKENVKIFTNSNDFPHDAVCKIEAPIKANLNVTTGKGNISLLNFNGEGIILQSETGNIAASRCHCNKISITSLTGDITCSNVMQAAEIYLKTSKSGSIATGRLQGLDLKVETENGNVQTESSYCNNSSFLTETGQLDLRSTHKNCKVIVKRKGVLNMTAFDGTLQAVLHKGEANIQLSRIEGDSEIKIEGTGSLKVKVSETCLENTRFKIISENVEVKDLKQKPSTMNEHIVLIPENETNLNVLIDCQTSKVVVENLSYMEMFNIKCSV